MKEELYDALLNIKTTGDQKGFNQSLHYHRYEATPYFALELLCKTYEFKSSDRIVDFGCGKRPFKFLYKSCFFDATAVGIEMNDGFYREAMENRNRYLKKKKHSKDKNLFPLLSG
ncbi:hypothetical protein GCM10020331_069830 [Ectobacillus funiculus]